MTATRRRFTFRADMRAARQRLAAVETSVVATPYGAVEYADRGSGPPVLVIHGVMGGVDAGLRNVACHVPDGYRIIVPSRFGYLRSALPPHATPARQADTYAALLDTIDIRTVAVIAASAGATSALQFAIRHPARIRALILVSPNVPGRHLEFSRLFAAVARLLWRYNFVFWAAERYAPRMVLGLMGVPEGVALSDAGRATVQAELDGIFPIDQRIDGILFDTFASNPDINTGYPLDAITAPTLVCHGRDDPGPPYHGAVALTRQIPGATLVSWDQGGHIGLATTRTSTPPSTPCCATPPHPPTSSPGPARRHRRPCPMRWDLRRTSVERISRRHRQARLAVR